MPTGRDRNPQHKRQGLWVVSCCGMAGHVSRSPNSDPTQDYHTGPPWMGTRLHPHHRHTRVFSPRLVPQKADTEHEDPLPTCAPSAHTHTPRHAEDTRYRYPQAASERPLSGAHSHSCNTRLRRTTLSALGGAARVARRRSHSRRPLWGPHEAAKSPQRDQLSRGLGSNQTHLRQPPPWRVRPKCESAPVTHHRLQGVRPALDCILLKLRDEQSDSPASSTRASNSSCQAQLWPPAPSAFPRGTYGPPARAQRGCRLP